ncbi:hypothetical protein DES53_101281 [Roseimicrobium gellanilyticum]|uniref:Uncharacterized protein n=2 Tax=Roseimicrobium gellanilyticum TaxID=748857 RepID=A0A366HVB4_9BACT|nr:hypothetical protein DES53_101281 [Roseimicrobium gellanilyticum]
MYHVPERDRDEDHLKMLALFHFIVAGIAAAGFAVTVTHYMIMKSILGSRVQMVTSSSGEELAIITPMPPLMKWGYVFALVLFIGGITLNGLSGWFLLKHRHRKFSLATAAFNCVQFPIGTILGVFTFIVLNRSTVRLKYYAAHAPHLPLA